ncbi:MAG: AroM family protein, partial [Candidatus Aminicenantales bacterium]
MSTRIGFLTIGQSPRTDVMAEISSLLGPGQEVEEAGALDELSSSKIRKLQPASGEFPLVTRLRDGSSVVVGRRKIIPLLQHKIDELENRGVSLVGFLCTGDFPGLRSSLPILFPSKLLYHLAMAIQIPGPMLVVAPLPEQEESLRERWERTGRQVFFLALNPYTTSRGIQLSEIVSERDYSLVVLDCIGYGLEAKRMFSQA